jgi:aminoglycoside phosphotransferase (APT) family kinase protein
VVEGLRALTGGASRATWAFDAVSAADRRALILRTDPPDDTHAGMELEARAQAAAAAAGAPVPHILVADNCAAPLGNPFLICDEVKGETVVRRIDRRLDDAGRARLLAQCAQALAAIHRADPGDVGLAAEDQLAGCRSQLDAYFDSRDDTTATFEWAFRWLAAHRPTPVPPRLVHGDFRMGNLVVDESGLAAVLDWELVHLGDVSEDLAWFCIRAWRFGAPPDRRRVGRSSRRVPVSLTRQSWRPRSGPANWTTEPTTSPLACARWHATGWRSPTLDTRTIKLASAACPPTSRPPLCCESLSTAMTRTPASRS